MTNTEKIEQIAFPIINKEFEERTPKGADSRILRIISSDMASIAEGVNMALENNPNLDIEKFTRKELAIYFKG
tara:strand:+ start:2945 stop:3163 length:219 start_codon:yes stop_codon:yes gene_type:complete